MKIGLTSIVLNKRGGIARYVVELAERFVKENEVHIITSRVEHPVQGAIIHQENIIWNPISAQVASAAIRNTLAANRLKKADVIDFIHGQGAEVVSPDVITAHSCHKAAVEQFKRERGLKYRLMKPFEPRSGVVLAIERRNFTARKFKKAIANSHNVKDDLMKYYRVPEEDIRVIYSGVDTQEFNPAKKAGRDKIREEIGIRPEDKVAVFSGWEFKRKGLMQIVKAMPEMKGVSVLVLGKDDPEPYRAEARKLGVANKLFFTGFVDNISDYYAAADLMVFPTAYEPFGLVIIEAMATGLPVVTSRSAGAAEIIEDGKDGILIDDPHSSREIAEKVNYIIDNDLFDSIGAKACVKANVCSWDNIARQTMDVYKEILQ
ncbi:Trehalose synthase [uncultured archaeon]|nr:Trehalose synthase [uncultured archaeon]